MCFGGNASAAPLEWLRIFYTHPFANVKFISLYTIIHIFIVSAKDIVKARHEEYAFSCSMNTVLVKIGSLK